MAKVHWLLGWLLVVGCGDLVGCSETEGPAGEGAGETGDGCARFAGRLIENARLPSGFCAYAWALDVPEARGIVVDGQGDVLVVARGAGQVLRLFDANGDGVSDARERGVVAQAPGLNHGIALHDGYLYASSASTVYRWRYSAARAPLGARETVVTGIPATGHSTRTLAFDRSGSLYVSVGSGSNVDRDSSRARIRRFGASRLRALPLSFNSGEVFADGLRNEVGLRFDSQDRLWGIENGVDQLNRADLGGDIHNDNPGEELNLFTSPGAFYGYPYCFSEFRLPGRGLGPGTQWVHPDFQRDGVHSDAWCRDPRNVVPPVLSLQAHSAPLDLLFYTGGSFPAGMRGDLFVGYHGSWNRTPETGYKVVRVPFGADGKPSGEAEDFFRYDSSSARQRSEWPHRPVGLAQAASGDLLVTSDASNQVIAIHYGL